MAKPPWRTATRPARTTLPVLVASCLLLRVGARKYIGWQRGGADYENLQSGFLAPQLTPVQFLMVSSPSRREITYTKLNNFRAPSGTLPLITSGLDTPRGLAYDEDREALYVADHGAQKIYRYHVYMKNGDAEDSQKFHSMDLACDGERVTILEGVPVSWVAADKAGDVFYSDPSMPAVGKIPYATVQSLVGGFYTSSDLSFLSEMELVKRAAHSLDPGIVPRVPRGTSEGLLETASDEQQRAEAAPAQSEIGREEQPKVSTIVHRLYEGAYNLHVDAPGGLATDGQHVYWTNTVNGSRKGSAVRGRIDPDLPVGSRVNETFQALALSNDTEQAFGIVKTKGLLVFSSQSNPHGQVYGLSVETGQVAALTSSLVEPRGLAWDGDQTVFVADQAKNGVWSLPIGRLSDDRPMSQAVAVGGAYGVAVLSLHLPDHAFHAGARGLRAAVRLWTFAALVVAWLGMGEPHP